MGNEPFAYGALLDEIKQRIEQAQSRAARAVNIELHRLYWEIGQVILSQQQVEGWGTGVIPRLAQDLSNDLAEIKGFSERNLKRMVQFAREYPHLFTNGPPAVAHLAEAPENVPIGPRPVAQLDLEVRIAAALLNVPWAHNVTLMQMLKDRTIRLWYAEEAASQRWSRDTLAAKISAQSHLRQGAAVTNFEEQLTPAHSALATRVLKDPYVFDFLTIEEPFHERELECALIRHLESFLLELGQGFAFVGRQHLLRVGDEEFYLDLLFYHLKLRSYVVIELKRGRFKPEYAGKLNFYCTAVDSQLKLPEDHPTIGLVLCQTKDRVVAEYALRDIHKPIGVADYELTRALPSELASSLPSIEQIESELQQNIKHFKDEPQT